MGKTPGATINPTKFDEIVVRRVIAGEDVGGIIRIVDQWEIIRRLVQDRRFHDGQVAYVLNLAGLKRSRESVRRTRKRLGIRAALERNRHNQHTIVVDAPSRPKALR